MSNKSCESFELSSLGEKDIPGQKLAQYLLSKDRGQKIHRLFDDKERRISVQVELIKPTEKTNDNAMENNGDKPNIETSTKASEPAQNGTRPEQLSPLRPNNSNDSLSSPRTERAVPRILSNLLLQASRSPRRTTLRMSEALPRPIFQQTPKSSKTKARISSSDRLRRLSFKHLTGGSGRRMLLRELNAAEDTTAFSDFEPHFKNLPGSTSTPASGETFSKLPNKIQTGITALSDVNRLNSKRNECTTSNTGRLTNEYTIRKGTIPGQVILTPCAVTSRKPSTSVRCEEEIEEATVQNPGITLEPRAQTNHDPISMILTDDEEEINVLDNDEADVAIAAVQNKTFVRPRSPIHKTGKQKMSIGKKNTLSLNNTTPVNLTRVSSSNNVGEMAENGDTNTPQSTVLTPFVIQTNIQTEVFDDSCSLEQVTFRNQSPDCTSKSRKNLRSKKRSTPDYIRTYKNATKKFKLKPNKSYINKSKRSLYCTRNENSGENSPLNCEVTSTNTAGTPTRDLLSNSRASSIHNLTLKPNEPDKQTHSATRSLASAPVTTQLNHSSNTPSHRRISKQHNKEISYQEPTLENMQTPGRRSRSRSKRKTVKESNTQHNSSQSSSSASSSEESCTRDQSPSANTTRAAIHSPSMPTSRTDIERFAKERTKLQTKLPHKQSIELQLRSSSQSSMLSFEEAELQSGDQQASPHSEREPASNQRKNTVRNPSREGALTKPLHQSNKRGRPKSSKSTKKVTTISTTVLADGSNCQYRRSQRERKPTKLQPYAIEIYTRCYFPEKYKRKVLENNTSKAKKPRIHKEGDKNRQKSLPTHAKNFSKNKNIPLSKKGKSNDEGDKNHQKNLQPQVKIKRLKMNAVQEPDIVNTMDTNLNDAVETEPVGIVSWLKSTNVGTVESHLETLINNYDGHFISRELLVTEQHNDVEFRFYNHGEGELSLGYIIFKPKAVKKMVHLKHSGIKFVCIYGEFKFKIKDRHSAEIQEHHCTVGDAFIVNVGDKYSIENLHETNYGQIIMIKMQPNDNLI